MDQSLILTPYSLSFPPDNGDGHYAQTFMFKPPNDKLYRQRGEIFVVLSIKDIPQQLDPTSLAKHIFDTLQQNYFGEPAGGVLEALEAATHQALQRGIQLVKPHKIKKDQLFATEFALCAVAVWAKSFYYSSTGDTFLGLVRGNQLINLGQRQLGSELLGGNDLLILATPAFAKQVLIPTIDEQEQPPNIGEKIHTLREKSLQLEAPTAAILLEVDIVEIPSEEEVIEIQIAEEVSHPKRKLQLSTLIQPFLSLRDKYLKLPFLKRLHTKGQSVRTSISSRKSPQPEIYLKPRFPQSKKGRLIVALFFITLLIATAFLTHNINQRKNRQRAEGELLTQAQQSLDKAQAAATLNRKEAQIHLTKAKTDLEKALDLNTKHDEVQLQSIRTGILAAENQIYQTQIISVSVVQFPEQLRAKRLIFDPVMGVISEKGDILLPLKDTWQTITAVDEYFNNLYLLDPSANQIYKYLAIPSGYSSRRNYLKQPADLQNAIDLAIDGSIYILFKGGRVEKYTAGDRDDFSLDSFHPPLAQTSLIETAPDAKNLYLVQNKSILIFNKDGTYQRQLSLKGVTLVDDLILADDSSKLWLHSQNNWYELPL